MASHVRIGPSRELAWPVWMMILGALMAFAAWSTQALGPVVGSTVRLLRWGLWVGLGLFVVGGLALLVQRVLAGQGTQMIAGWGGLLVWPGIVFALLLAFGLAVAPVPWNWQWVSTLLTIVSIVCALTLVLLQVRAGPTPPVREARRTLAEGQIARAKTLLEATESAQDDYYLHDAWARIHRQEGRPQAALASADRMVALRPDLCFGHIQRGSLLMALNRPDEALDALQEAVRRAPRVAQTHLHLGVARAEVGSEKPLAAQALARALHLGLREDVARLIARYYLYKLFLDLHQPDRARREWRRLRLARGTLKQWRAATGDLALPLGRRRTPAKLANDIHRTLSKSPKTR